MYTTPYGHSVKLGPATGDSAEAEDSSGGLGAKVLVDAVITDITESFETVFPILK